MKQFISPLASFHVPHLEFLGNVSSSTARCTSKDIPGCVKVICEGGVVEDWAQAVIACQE